MPDALQLVDVEDVLGTDSDGMQMPTRVCVIDLGTNSFHALIVDAFPNGTYAVVDKIKEMVRLGERSLVHHRLTEAAMQRSVEALRRIRILADGWGATEYLAFATSAVRESENGGDFIERVRKEIGLQVRVISGEQEATLIYKAVRRVVDLNEPALLVDIGGGSTEFIAGDSRQVYHLCSLKIGAARMTEQLITTEPVEPKEFKRLRASYRAVLQPVYEAARRLGIRRLVGSSGAMENLAQAYAFLYGEPDTSIFQQAFNGRSFRRLTKHIMQSRREERAVMPGIDRKRVDQIVAGAVLVDVLVKDLNIEEIVISPSALRDGMVLHFIEQNYSLMERLAAFSSVRRRSVYEQAFRFRWEKPHARHVTAMALRIFDACAPLHGLGKQARELLEYASLLHDVGYLISWQHHHRHTLYLILNADLHGFKGQEVEVIANVARYHSGSLPRPAHPEYQRLMQENQILVNQLAAILRIANGLDRSHFQNVQRLKVELDEKKLTLIIQAQTDPQLEVWGVRRGCDLFEKTFNRRVEVVAHYEDEVRVQNAF